MKKMSIGVLVFGVVLLLAVGCNEENEAAKKYRETPVPQDQNAGVQQIPSEGLEEIANALSKKVFPDFQTVKMDPLDAFPVFQATKATTFRRLQRKVPISSKVGRTYPRILLKMYEFASLEDLEKEVNLWLAGLESSAEALALGQEAASVKSPPLLCAVEGNRFYIVQSACLYDGPEWQADTQRFFEEMKGKGAGYAWEIGCGEGKLVYEIKPEADPG